MRPSLAASLAALLALSGVHGAAVRTPEASLHLVPASALAQLDCPTAALHALLATPVDQLALVAVPAECASLRAAETEVATVRALDEDSGLLVYLRPSTVDGGRSNVAFERLLAPISSTKGQIVLSTASVIDGLTLLHSRSTGALVHLSWAALERITTDPGWALVELQAVSPTPLPIEFDLAQAGVLEVPVPEASRKRIVDQQTKLRFSPLVSQVISTLPVAQFTRDLEILTGYDQSALNATDRWVSRHSMSDGIRNAAAWIKSELETAGGLDCSYYQYLPLFSPDIICRWPSVSPSNETIVLSAHYDSRGSWGSTRAPGADDDGSGTAMLLSLARHVYEHRIGFGKNVVIAAFSGEEQGLIGSGYFARKLKEEGEDVLLMIQADMLAYRKPGEPIQLAFPDKIGLPEAKWFVGNVSSLYVPALVVGETPACCSDHQSFNVLGYASTWAFERNAPIWDPCYHNSCDELHREGYSIEQLSSIAKVVLATLFHVADFVL